MSISMRSLNPIADTIALLQALDYFNDVTYDMNTHTTQNMLTCLER